MKFIRNRKRCGEETEKKNVISFLGKVPAGQLFCKFHTTTKRREFETRIVERVVRSLSKLRHAFFVRNFRVNMVAAIDWCSHTTHDWIWLFWVFGPLRQYFSLYRAVSQRGRKKREKIDERQKSPNNPTRTYCKRSGPKS